MKKADPKVGSCRRCGLCCQTICLSLSVTDLMHMRGPEPEFALKYFEPISVIEAWNRNPRLLKWRHADKRFYYFCKAFKVGIGCSLYEDRPGTCSRHETADYSNACGYARSDVLGGFRFIRSKG
jgi:hypothetical protein